MPGVQKIQPVLHQCGVKALLPQLHLLELVSAWNGERRRSKGSLATHTSIPTKPVLPQTQPCVPMPQNHLRNRPRALWGREVPSPPYRLISVIRFSPPRLPSPMPSVSVHAVAHLSWRLHAGTAGRQDVHTEAEPFSACWKSLLGHRSSLGQQWLPFLLSLQSLRGRERRALSHTVPVASSPLCPAPARPWQGSLVGGLPVTSCCHSHGQRGHRVLTNQPESDQSLRE